MSEGIQTMAQNLQVWDWPFSLLKSQPWVPICLNVSGAEFRKFIYLRVVPFFGAFNSLKCRIFQENRTKVCDSVSYYATVVDLVQSLGKEYPIYYLAPRLSD